MMKNGDVARIIPLCCEAAVRILSHNVVTRLIVSCAPHMYAYVCVHMYAMRVYAEYTLIQY